MISTDEFENHIYIFQSRENKALEVLQIFDYVGRQISDFTSHDHVACNLAT